jgi:hypothetical protein
MQDDPPREQRRFHRRVDGRAVQVTVTCADGWRVRAVVIEGRGGIAPTSHEAYPTPEVAGTVGLWIARMLLSPHT